MTIPSPNELGNNSVVIGIDNDRASQGAVKWVIEHFLKGEDLQVVLLHVKTHYISSQYEPVFKNGRAPNEAELHQLFLSFRGYCARKGFDAHEVVLQDLDISGALINYIENNNIGTIVVGASTRNALTRRFRHADVPTSLIKSAPDFCAVYVISKGKVQSVRAASGSVKSTGGSTGTIRSYSSNYSISNNSNITDQSSQMLESSATNEHSYASSNLSSNSGSSSYYNARLKSLLGQPPAPPRRSGSFDDASRNSYGRERPRSDEMDHYPWNNDGARTSSRFMQSPSRSLKFINSPPRFIGSPDNHGFSFNSSSSNGSFESSEYSNDQSSCPSTSSYGSYSESFPTGHELDAEIRRLKLDSHEAMDMYQSISEQAATTKRQADEILNQEEKHTMEDIKLAKQATMLLAELEQLKTKAAMDAAYMTERLAQLETEKRKNVEKREKNKEKKNKRTTNGFSTTYRIYSLEEIEVATNYFSTSQQIGEGGYGPVYRAILQHTPVAIKVLRPDLSRGIEQFEKEIEVLGRIRHPHMVLLLGACPQNGCLVYEYMDNGSLEDRLFCKNRTSPIPWRARFRIAAEVTTALLFLHQAKPNPMVHRDLKPANILLDANYSSKISDVGLARLVPPNVANEITQYHMTAAAGTFCYIDPEYQQTGLLGTKSDVYSLGVVLLQLITAKAAMALAYNVEEAIEMGEFADMLDQTIPDWPVEQALSVAQLALKCCELRKKDRPDLSTVVLPELNRLRDFALSS